MYSRGVEKRTIFHDDQDRFRFIHDLFELNDQSTVPNIFYRFTRHSRQHQSIEVRPRYIPRDRNPRKLLVEILAFCLMPNHFHLLLRQKIDRGITRFMQKLGTGYTMYFNQKQQRVGPLFQGRFKAIHVGRDSHFIHLPFYIHLNPLDLYAPEWRMRVVKDYRKVLHFLETYRWSSHLDYLGKQNFPSVTQRAFLSRFFGGPEKYKQAVVAWLKTLELENIRHLTLE